MVVYELAMARKDSKLKHKDSDLNQRDIEPRRKDQFLATSTAWFKEQLKDAGAEA